MRAAPAAVPIEMNPSQNPMQMRQGAMPPNGMQQTSVIQGLSPQQILQVQAVQAAQAAQAAQFSGGQVMNGNPQMVTAGGRVMGTVYNPI